MTPGFHFQILERFVEVMEGCSNILAEKLDQYEGKEVNVFPICNMFALDTVCGNLNLLNSSNFNNNYFKSVQWE